MYKSNATLQPVGIDDFQAKFMKYVDEKVHSAIAYTYNTTVLNCGSPQGNQH